MNILVIKIWDKNVCLGDGLTVTKQTEPFSLILSMKIIISSRKRCIQLCMNLSFGEREREKDTDGYGFLHL